MSERKQANDIADVKPNQVWLVADTRMGLQVEVGIVTGVFPDDGPHGRVEILYADLQEPYFAECHSPYRVEVNLLIDCCGEVEFTSTEVEADTDRRPADFVDGLWASDTMHTEIQAPDDAVRKMVALRELANAERAA